MFIQLCNIISGLFLASPLAANVPALKPYADRYHEWLAPYTYAIGMGELVVGTSAFFIRASGLAHMTGFGESYPQAFAALAIGAALSPALIEKFPHHEEVTKFKEYIGLAGITVGLLSIF